MCPPDNVREQDDRTVAAGVDNAVTGARGVRPERDAVVKVERLPGQHRLETQRAQLADSGREKGAAAALVGWSVATLARGSSPCSCATHAVARVRESTAAETGSG